ncbi:MAG TPA: hypothetical protein V6C71_23620 [Coleofasciculaceae cyanobacterium]|jgi:hypothetical protein
MSSNGDYTNPNNEFQGDRFSAETSETSSNRQSESQNNAWLSIEIYIKANQPRLLDGLEQWLQLNLISQEQVKKLSRNHLSCALPDIEVVKPILAPTQTILETEEKVLVKTAKSANIFARILQGFLDELSIRWLLFLGIFLVVISSSVLAASQWQNFPKVGQYLILLAYTIGFWGTGFWTSKHNSLKLTSQTIGAIATLLIPINFWAINHLGLGNNPIDWLVIAVAAIILTAIVYLSPLPKKSNRSGFLIPLLLLLSYIHLGWQIPLLPLVSIYGGMMAICLIHYRFLLPQQKYPLVNLLFILAAWSLLLVRKIITNAELAPNYCLAIAFLAWLLATIYLAQAKKIVIPLDRQEAAVAEAWGRKICQVFSLILFTLTWLISIVAGITNSPLFFWQTVSISALVIHLFSQRLTLYWRKQDLTAIFLIGLQTLYISKELIPHSLRNQALDLSVAVGKTEYFPESVLGVTLFPYIILFVFIATWLYRRQKLQLALYTEYLILLLGIVLTCLSLSNPTWRSLNLVFSTLTLGYVAHLRQPVRSSLIYLTHLLGLITIAQAIAVILPDLSKSVWGSIFVALMAIEWIVYIRRVKQPRIKPNSHFSLLEQSCWHFGLLLSAVSYTCFLADIEASTPNAFRWGLVWLITPVMLTLVAKNTRNIRQRRLATMISCLALIVAQLLVFGSPETRFIGLATATGLMSLNAFNLRRTIIAIIHLGFVLSLVASLLSSFIGNNLISYGNLLPIGGATILGLYQFRFYLKRAIDAPKFSYISQRSAHGLLGVGAETRNFKLINKYIAAADYWAIALITLAIAIVSIIYLDLRDFGVYWQYLLTSGLLISAIFWRYRQQPNNLVLYTLTWLWGLFAVGLVMLLGQSSFLFATTNIVLGLVALGVLGRLAQSDCPWARLNLAHIPLIYAALGLIWRLSAFNAYTGWLSLGAAFILINTQQNNDRANAVINYFGFAGISLGIYELVIYQMQSAPGGSVADGLTILAFIAAAIAFSYRLGAWWYRQRQYPTLFNLRLAKVILIAHIHWAIGSVLKVFAAGVAIESVMPRLTLVSIATSFCLGAYAVIQGKDRQADSSEAKDWWVYIGLVEIAATLVYSRLIISRLSLFDPWRVIFTCAVAWLIYQIPWQNFGWRATPWRRTALIIPALMALVMAEDISSLSLLVTALFYLRIAYAQRNIRWSYISLGLINWAIIRLVWQYNTEFIWIAGIISLSILYIAQYDPYYQSYRQQRHYLRLVGSSIICIFALFEQPGIMTGAIAFAFIFIGLGFKVRAFLFTGTITLIITVIHQLIILVVTYSFLKWVIGLLTGICSIAIAAGFEKQRDRALNQLKNYTSKLQNWH